MAQTFAEREPEAFAAQVMELFGNGGTLKDVGGYTEREFEALYAMGYNLYNQAKYGDALLVFGFLLMHDQFGRKYYKAMGSCQQMLKRYEDAIRNYSMASLLDLQDPEPTFHTAECMVALGMVQEAREALDMVERQTRDKPERKAMHDRAEAMLKLLEAR